MSAKPARGVRGPGSVMAVRQRGGCRATSQSDIRALEVLPLRSLPQPMGAGSSRPLNPLRRVPCRTKARHLGCKGEKPWHLCSNRDRANGRPEARIRQRTTMPHCAASACGGRERSNRPSRRGTDSSRDMPTPGGEGAVACSLRPSAGGANGEAMPRARCHPAGRPGSLSLPRLAAEPGPRVLRSGFSAPPYRDPTRLPRIQSTIGDQSSRLDHWPASRRHRHQGLTSALRPPLAVAPCAK